MGLNTEQGRVRVCGKRVAPTQFRLGQDHVLLPRRRVPLFGSGRPEEHNGRPAVGRGEVRCSGIGGDNEPGVRDEGDQRSKGEPAGQDRFLRQASLGGHSQGACPFAVASGDDHTMPGLCQAARHL